MNTQIDDEQLFKSKIVSLILNNQAEKALELLCQHYHVSSVKLEVGMPKRDTKHQACYVAKNKTIHIAHHDILTDPYIILHEFYHHLRTTNAKHRGTEKNANAFAKQYLIAYQNHSTAATFDS
ncbi:MAG: hypothetical protein ACUVT5_00245 [Candidatus Bathyarchaeales archaeon]